MTAEKLYNGIYCMDCMELLAQIPDGYVSMILTDPPYGISYRNNFTKRKHRVLAGDEGIDYERFARESYRILKEDSPCIFFYPVRLLPLSLWMLTPGRVLHKKTAWWWRKGR